MKTFRPKSLTKKTKTNRKTKRIKIAGVIVAMLVVSSIALFFANPLNVDAQRRSRRRTQSTVTQLLPDTTVPTAPTSPTPPTGTTSTPTGSTASTAATGATTASGASLPFTNNLVGYWKLNGNALGALGKDNGTAVGSVNYVPGKFGQAAHFNGSSYIEIPDQDYFSPSTTGMKMSVSFWFKPDTYNFGVPNSDQPDSYVNFLGKANGPGADEWEFRLDNETAYDGFSRSERMNFYAFNQSGGLGAGSALNKACPLSTWTHVVGEVDGTNTRLYVNGRLVDSDLLSDYAIHMSNTSAPLRIGATDKEAYLQGSVSNLMIFNRALSDSEVSQLYGTSL